MSTSEVSGSPLETGNLSKGGSTGGKEKDNTGSQPEPPNSPDAVKCAICLGDVVNRSCSDNCSHQFCFGCLLEWSKVKPECPLCKSSFRSIHHNFRSNTEYDEYSVPAPVPHLSIRFTASAGGNYRFHPFIRVLEARAAQLSPLNMSHSHSHGVGPDGGVTVASLANMFPSSSSFMFPPSTNPFSSASSSSFRAEYFGDILTNEFRSHEDASQMRGYQNRRRRYDRNEWVESFGSALQPGAGVLPSVEYIRSHPSATSRLRNWLFRELNVLMGIHRNRDQMGFLYDLIMHLLTIYDIRSRDFRDSISAYLGSTRTSHFQHELYHFLLSGMTMEEYDRVAEYPSSNSSSSNSNRSTVNSGSSAQPLPRRNVPPEVITLDSDDEERSAPSLRNLISFAGPHPASTDDIIVVESSSSSDEEDDIYPSMVANLNLLAERNSSNRHFAAATSANSSSLHDEPPHTSASGSCTRRRDDLENSIRQRMRSRVFDSDPEMPVLEPQVLSFPSANAATPSRELAARTREIINTTIDRSLATAATTTVTANHSNTITSSPSPELISHSRSRRDSDSERLSFMGAEFDLDLNVSVEPYSSPPPAEPSRPLRSPDFPILQYREFRRNFLRDRDSMRSNFRREFISSFISNQPSTSRTSEGGSRSGSAFVAYEPDVASDNPPTLYPSSSQDELSRPPRPSCSYDNGNHSSSCQEMPSASAAYSCRGGRQRSSSPSPAFRIDLYPHGMSSSQVMDLSRSAGLIPPNSSSSASRTVPSTSYAERTFRPPCPPPPVISSPLNLAAATASTSSKKEKTADAVNEQSDSDELECLGSFPIQKKPPLAVITISSEDEDDSAIKAEKNDDMLNILSTDDETALIDEFINWGSQSVPPELNLLDGPTPPLQENAYLRPNSSSSSDFFEESPIASTSRGIAPNSSGPSTSNPIIGSKRLTRSGINNVWQSVGIKQKSDPAYDCIKSRYKHSHRSTSPSISPPKKRCKRLQISSSSDESSNENDKGDDNNDTEVSFGESQHISLRSSTRVRLPKKRMFIEVPSTPSPPPTPIYNSSEDSDSSSSDDGELDTKSSSKNSKKHIASASTKKKYKSKSKKSKKSKKHRSKERRRRSRSISGNSGKGDKSKTSGTGTSVSVDAGCSSRKGTSSGGSKHSPDKKFKEGSRVAKKSTGGLLDLSFSSRSGNDDDAPSLLRHGITDEERNFLDMQTSPLQQPHPHLNVQSDATSSSSSSLSTVDPSALFGPGQSSWFA